MEISGRAYCIFKQDCMPCHRLAVAEPHQLRPDMWGLTSMK